MVLMRPRKGARLSVHAARVVLVQPGHDGIDGGRATDLPGLLQLAVVRPERPHEVVVGADARLLQLQQLVTLQDAFRLDLTERPIDDLPLHGRVARISAERGGSVTGDPAEPLHLPERELTGQQLLHGRVHVLVLEGRQVSELRDPSGRTPHLRLIVGLQ